VTSSDCGVTSAACWLCVSHYCCHHTPLSSMIDRCCSQLGDARKEAQPIGFHIYRHAHSLIMPGQFPGVVRDLCCCRGGGLCCFARTQLSLPSKRYYSPHPSQFLLSSRSSIINRPNHGHHFLPPFRPVPPRDWAGAPAQ
jgi:hypothetical protein